ncbi:MAG: DUF924 family protein [Gammaproteobacteria bacterium]|nr:DUF924 family protein [Gammaproteobacteria bacterium]
MTPFTVWLARDWNDGDMDTTDFEPVLAFWFADRTLDALTLDSRMQAWFGNSPAFDAELGERFAGRVKQAFAGELDHWAADPRGRLALILLLGQFPRHLHKHSKLAFRGDSRALRLCQQGVADGSYRQLSPLQQLFFFMPLQRIESLKIQAMSVRIYAALAKRSSATLRDTFETVAQFAELRHDIVAQFGRFPHRDAVLGRVVAEPEDALTAS